MTTTEQGPGASDIGRSTIKIRKVTHWQPNFSLSGPGEPGTYLFQLVLDNGASEVVLTVNVDDADNLFDWLSASSEVFYDLEREVMASIRDGMHLTELDRAIVLAGRARIPNSAMASLGAARRRDSSSRRSRSVVHSR